MADMRRSLVSAGIARGHNNLVPAHVLETKRAERAERIRLATSTIIAQGLAEEASAS